MKQKKALQPAPDELRAEAAVNELLGTHRFDYDEQAKPGKADFLLDPIAGAGPKVALEVSSTTDPHRQGLWRGLDQHCDRPIPGLQGYWASSSPLGCMSGGRPRLWSSFSSAWSGKARTG